MRIERGVNSRDRDHDLAFALHVLGANLVDSGRLGKALLVIDEALTIRERLAERASELDSTRRLRELCLGNLTAAGYNVLGPYPLCEQCQETNGGLIATRHRQVHVRAHGKESCVDERLAEIIAALWEVCDTTTCCQDQDGQALIAPLADQLPAASARLADLGIVAADSRGYLTFALPDGTGPRDAGAARAGLA